ncbi:hypothetical protein R1sor_022756 [Riccia sorocarpa]|uniref:Uncharacterized protein n=1 Tax=Riccia sorocarpa TaxID=122646 RepID=A0ABD3GKR2_9MARC
MDMAIAETSPIHRRKGGDDRSVKRNMQKMRTGHRNDPAPYVELRTYGYKVEGTVTKELWLERNHYIFRGRNSRRPLLYLLKEAADEAALLANPEGSDETRNRNWNTIQTLEEWIQHLHISRR